MTRLEGKTAVVIGSTKGMGLAIARAYVKEGARVVINSRSAEDCAAVSRALGSAATPIAADLSRSDEVRPLAREGAHALGGVVDIVVAEPQSSGRLPWVARTTVLMPPRMLKSPSTSIQRGAATVTKSFRMRLVTSSWKAPSLRYDQT